MAARISTGTPWPDGTDCPSGSVILITAEDDPGDTIRPRLDAHRADVRNVHLLSAVRRVGEDGQPHEVLFTLADVAALETALKAVPDCRLIVVDPIGSFLGGDTDAHRDNEVRSVLAPVARLAEKYGAAVLVVAHRRKGVGSIADDLALGSRAFTGIARAVWHVTRDPENKARRLLLPGKNNLAPEGNGLAFAIVGDPGAVAWERDPVEMSADDALALENGNSGNGHKPGPDPEAQNQAADWLARELADFEEHPVRELKDAAKEAGLAWRTVQKASQRLGVKVHRATFGGGCVWRLLKPKASAPGIRATPAENGEPGAIGANGESQGKAGDSARRDCHTRRDVSLGANGADNGQEWGEV
jgi:putative DNA primase/helicase